MIRREVRRARKDYRCEGTVSVRCTGHIWKGDRYLFHVASPDHGDIGDGTWQTLRACAACAEIYGTPVESEEDE